MIRMESDDSTDGPSDGESWQGTSSLVVLPMPRWEPGSDRNVGWHHSHCGQFRQGPFGCRRAVAQIDRLSSLARRCHHCLFRTIFPSDFCCLRRRWGHPCSEDVIWQCAATALLRRASPNRLFTTSGEPRGADSAQDDRPHIRAVWLATHIL